VAVCVNCGRTSGEGTQYCPACGSPLGHAAGPARPIRLPLARPEGPAQPSVDFAQAGPTRGDPGRPSPSGDGPKSTLLVGLGVTVAALVLIVVILVAFKPFGRGDDGSPAPAPSETSSVSPTTAATPSPTPTGTGSPSPSPTPTIDPAKDAQVRSGADAIAAAIARYSAYSHVYPATGTVVPGGSLEEFLPTASWPVNPYTQTPMTGGGGFGDFTYTLNADGSGYQLLAHLGDGTEYVAH
jgi:hypothetical protein